MDKERRNGEAPGQGGGKAGKGGRRKRHNTAESRLKEHIENKIVVVNAIVLLSFVFLAWRVLKIQMEDGETYNRQILSQQAYDSVTIPYQRGTITDRNGTILAYSERVYNVILDAYLLKDKADGTPNEQREIVVTALAQNFDLNADEIRGFIRDNPDSRYRILAKNVSYDQMEAYQNYVEEYNARVSEENKEREVKLPLFSGRAVWFEDQFKRTYPGGSLACNVIGFTTADGQGQYGLEEYYDDVLCGSNGREYGYLSDENALERTYIPARNGNTVVSTIDSYLQRICEEKILEYNVEHEGEYRAGEMGSENTGVIIMDVHTGEVLAMASYPYFDLNDPWDLSMYTEDEINYLVEREGSEEAAVQSLWRNFCISQAYEPGSVCKTYTVAAALDAGVIHDGDHFHCGGYLTFGEGEHSTTIRCHQRNGDGDISVKVAVEKSCNVALMLMGQKLGRERFITYQRNFNFGLKTNIDLAGEMRTASLVFNENNMGITELMTSTFGQGFKVTMIQNIAAYCSLVNGGYYYQPHIVKQILDENGAVVENREPVVLRQVVSESVSDLMIDYCIGVVEEGTGTRARPAGYRIGGKTGTAEYSGQGKRDYTVSFMGFAPADDPQIAIYVVIDRPNTASQENGTRYACLLCRSILTEALPYLHIFPTQPLTDAEEEELRELQESGVQPGSVSENAAGEGEGAEGEDATEAPDGAGEDSGTGEDVGEGEPEQELILEPDADIQFDDDSPLFQDANGNPVQIIVLEDPEEER